MKTYAYIPNGSDVVEILAPLTDADGNEIDISERYTPDFVALCVECDASVEAGMLYTAPATFARPPTPPDVTDYVSINAGTQVQLMTVATAANFGMGDAYVAGLLDEADTAKFKEWAAYKLALSKVDLTQAEPAWPTVPAST